MIHVAAGGLRRRIEIQGRATTVDNYGGDSKAWSTRNTRWASIETLSGVELMNAQQMWPTVTHRVEMRYDSLIQKTDRLAYGSRVFQIVAVLNDEQHKLQTICMCKETGEAAGNTVPISAIVQVSTAGDHGTICVVFNRPLLSPYVSTLTMWTGTYRAIGSPGTIYTITGDTTWGDPAISGNLINIPCGITSVSGSVSTTSVVVSYSSDGVLKDTRGTAVPSFSNFSATFEGIT